MIKNHHLLLTNFNGEWISNKNIYILKKKNYTNSKSIYILSKTKN